MTPRACNTNNRSIPVVLPRNRRASNARGRNTSNLATLNQAHDHKKLNEYGVSLFLANTMSLAPKIDEVKCVISDVNPDLAFFTETQETLSAKTTSTSQGTISLQGTVLQALTVELACMLKTTWSSSPWTIYTILILNNVDVAAADQTTAWNHLSDCWYCIPPPNCQRHCYANHLETTLTSIGGKREWSERSNPLYMTLFLWKLFSIYFWFCVRLRVFFLFFSFFSGLHLIGQLEWRHIIFNLARNSFHYRPRKACDMTCELGYYFRPQV